MEKMKCILQKHSVTSSNLKNYPGTSRNLQKPQDLYMLFIYGENEMEFFYRILFFVTFQVEKLIGKRKKKMEFSRNFQQNLIG